MIASEIIYRARSVSDLPASKFVSHQDELDSLNEAWKDIYSRLVENDDDYYLTETTLTLNAAVAVAGANNEYLITLPSDFLKLRYLDFRGFNDYIPMKKFNLSMKDNEPGDPYYRIKGNQLWVIGGSVPATGLTLRMGYYPATPVITCPQTPLPYATSYAPNLFPLVTAPAYSPYLQQMAYVYNSTGIRSESITSATVSAPVALFTEAGPVTNMVYYKGTLYWIRGGLIWYKATDLTVLFVAPTQATTPAGVTSFYILNNVIYYTNATQIRTCDLTGGTDALVSATVATSVAAIFVAGNTTVFYTTAAGLLGNIVTAFSFATTLYATGISDVQSDGTNLYIRDTAGYCRKLILSLPLGAVVTVTTDTIVKTGVTDIGQPVYDVGQVPAVYIMPVITGEAQTLIGLDTAIDYSFSYPNNIVPEIMAWQSAVDYRTKQGADVEGHKFRLAALWERFSDTVKRDEYQPERIRNIYANSGYGI
jgi:hypothetical protein